MSLSLLSPRFSEPINFEIDDIQIILLLFITLPQLIIHKQHHSMIVNYLLHDFLLRNVGFQKILKHHDIGPHILQFPEGLQTLVEKS